MHFRILWGIALLLVAALPLAAQTETPSSGRILIEGLNPANNTVQLAWFDLESGELQPLTTLSGVAICPPALGRTSLLYEPILPAQAPYVYRVDLATGNAIPVDVANELHLQCPAIHPNNERIAWVRQSETANELVLTNPEGGEVEIIASYRQILGPRWSPDGQGVGFLAIAEEPNFRQFFLWTETSQIDLWSRAAGLLHDYRWLADDQLAVIYETQINTLVGLLPIDCEDAPPCEARPIAVFPRDTDVSFATATPIADDTLLVAATFRNTTTPSTRLYRVDIESGGREPLLTGEHDLIQLDALARGEHVYIAGSRWDDSVGNFAEQGLYLWDSENESLTQVYESGTFYPIRLLAIGD